LRSAVVEVGPGVERLARRGEKEEGTKQPICLHSEIPDWSREGRGGGVGRMGEENISGARVLKEED